MLTGPVTVYIAPAVEAEPDVDQTPAGNWVEFGPTDGEQTMGYSGDIELHRDNDHQGAVKATRPEEQMQVTIPLRSMTLEHVGRVLNSVSDVAEDGGPPAIKQLPNKRGFDLTEYSLLLKGSADSPYGAFPGQNYIPRCVAGGEIEVVRGKEGHPIIEVVFEVLEDDTQSAGDEMGWATVQTA
jgi:hypothetical protein